MTNYQQVSKQDTVKRDTHNVIDLEDAAHCLGSKVYGRHRHQQRLHHILLQDVGDGTLYTHYLYNYQHRTQSVSFKSHTVN